MRRMLPLLLTLALLCALPLGGGAEYALNSVTWRKPVLVERIEQITQPILRLAVGNRLRLDCRVLPENADNPVLLWSSSNEAVAAVDGGILVCVGAGKCIVTAEAADDSGVQTQWRVTVEAAKVQAIRPVTQSPCHLHVGDTIRLEYRIEPESLQGAPVTWRSSDERVATVTDGVVTCVGEGKCSITAAAVGTAVSRTWQIHAAEHFLWRGALTETAAIPGTDLTLRLPEGWYQMYADDETGQAVYGKDSARTSIFCLHQPDLDPAFVERFSMVAEMLEREPETVMRLFEENIPIPISGVDQLTIEPVLLQENITVLTFRFIVSDPEAFPMLTQRCCVAGGLFFRGDEAVAIEMQSTDETLLAEGAATEAPFTGDAVSILYEDFLAILETLSAGL